MPQTAKSRRETLEDFVAKNPADAFARYALAMECARTGDTAAALQHFQALHKDHPDYVAGYFHHGQLLAQLGRTEEARQTLAAGTACAENKGDLHALAEMQAALDALA